MNPVLQDDERRENMEARKRIENMETEREVERRRREERNERKEGTRAGMSHLLVSQTRGRYLQADQWQSTERPGIFVGFSVVIVD